MLCAITSFAPATSSLYGAVSREEPQPFERPLTMTSKPPAFSVSFPKSPPRRPTSEKRPSVSS